MNSGQVKYPVNTLGMINLTPHEIPNSIKEFLQHGRNTAIGGFQPEHEIFLEINYFFLNSNNTRKKYL